MHRPFAFMSLLFVIGHAEVAVVNGDAGSDVNKENQVEVAVVNGDARSDVSKENQVEVAAVNGDAGSDVNNDNQVEAYYDMANYTMKAKQGQPYDWIRRSRWDPGPQPDEHAKSPYLGKPNGQGTSVWPFLKIHGAKFDGRIDDYFNVRAAVGLDTVFGPELSIRFLGYWESVDELNNGHAFSFGTEEFNNNVVIKTEKDTADLIFQIYGNKIGYNLRVKSAIKIMEWHEYMFSVTALGVMNCFIDGKLVAQEVDGSEVPAVPRSYLYIGKSAFNAADPMFRGRLLEIALYDKAIDYTKTHPLLAASCSSPFPTKMKKQIQQELGLSGTDSSPPTSPLEIVMFVVALVALILQCLVLSRACRGTLPPPSAAIPASKNFSDPHDKTHAPLKPKYDGTKSEPHWPGLN